MHYLDDLIFFISSYSTMFNIGNVVREDQNQCV
jgi:hypothetical protein